jgi:hypothetical protein
LANDLRNYVVSTYKTNNDIASSLDSNQNNIANVSCVKTLNNSISNNYILKDDIITAYNSETSSEHKIVSEKLLSDAISDIGDIFSPRSTIDVLIHRSDNVDEIGDSTTKTASQKLMYELNNNINSCPIINDYANTDNKNEVLYINSNNNDLGFKDLLYQDFAVFINGVDTDELTSNIHFHRDTFERELSSLPTYYTIFGDGVTNDNVYQLTANNIASIFGNSSALTVDKKLSTLYDVLNINGITNTSTNYFDTTKFNVVEQGTIVYNKITGKKFYFIDKNFIQF